MSFIENYYFLLFSLFKIKNIEYKIDDYNNFEYQHINTLNNKFIENFFPNSSSSSSSSPPSSSPPSSSPPSSSLQQSYNNIDDDDDEYEDI